VYRFALRPWWIVSHIVVLAIVVAFVNLGVWQLRRLDEVQERNAQLAARLAEDPADVAGLVASGETDGAAIEDRRVTATGTYRADEIVLIRGRSLDDAPGSWVVAPLELDDGRVVAVNRGWIRNDGRFTEVPDEYRTVPEGEVAVEGLLHSSQERGTFGPTDPPDGQLETMARVDLDRLDEQVEGDVLPVWIQLTTAEAGAPDPSPQLLDLPVVNDEGPHLSYAVQWAIFATIAIGGYPLILRRAARERGQRHPDDAPGLDDPDPDDEPHPSDPRLDTSIT
jgi:surfeit locus 1 family protein